jgi:hypothetical protein
VAEVERGAVAYEIREAQRDQGFLFEQAVRASELLDAQGSHFPDDLARPWKRLRAARQVELGDELLEIVRFGVTTEDLAARAGVSPESERHISHAVEAYYDALPFTKGEHDWLWDMRSGAVNDFEAEEAGMSAIHWVMAQRGELRDLGRLRSVSGKELIGREWDWIRGAGEFAGSSTYDEARTALRSFVRLFDAQDRTGFVVPPPELTSQ